MNELVFGLSVAAIGITVVFAGLVLLIFCVKLITLISTERKAKQQAAPVVAEPVEAPVIEEVPQGIAPETIAAITAAVAAVWEGDTGFVVRRVRRVHNAAAWNRAGREDQVYSRM